MQWSISINVMWKKQSKDLDTLFRDGASRLFSHPLTCQWWSSSRHPPCPLVWYQHCWNDWGYQTGLLKEFRKILSKTQTRVRTQSSGDKESVPFVTWNINKLQKNQEVSPAGWEPGWAGAEPLWPCKCPPLEGRPESSWWPDIFRTTI